MTFSIFPPFLFRSEAIIKRESQSKKFLRKKFGNLRTKKSAIKVIEVADERIAIGYVIQRSIRTFRHFFFRIYYKRLIVNICIIVLNKPKS